MKPSESLTISEKYRKRLEGALWLRIHKLDRRLLPHQLDAVVEEICGCGAWGLRELGDVLGRSAVYLQNTSIKRLLAEGRIRFAHPGEPNHPRQAYVVGMVKRETQPVHQDDTVSIGMND